jgi:predicted nucleic acid-binding protein
MIELADTSVLGKRGKPAVAAWFTDALIDGQIAVCDMTMLESLTAARDHADFVPLEQALQACPWYRVGPADWDRARAVYRELARKPLHHRSVEIADLLIAAVAERAGVPLVHYDADFDTIAQVTGQATRWAAPRGSL